MVAGSSRCLGLHSDVSLHAVRATTIFQSGRVGRRHLMFAKSWCTGVHESEISGWASCANGSNCCTGAKSGIYLRRMSSPARLKYSAHRSVFPYAVGQRGASSLLAPTSYRVCLSIRSTRRQTFAEAGGNSGRAV